MKKSILFAAAFFCASLIVAEVAVRTYAAETPAYCDNLPVYLEDHDDLWVGSWGVYNYYEEAGRYYVEYNDPDAALEDVTVQLDRDSYNILTAAVIGNSLYDTPHVSGWLVNTERKTANDVYVYTFTPEE